MSNRYNKIQKILNNSSEYFEIFNSKGVNNITQYSSYNFGNLKNITEADLDSVVHIVQPYERLYMISQKYYGSPDYGWLICYTNKISNELDISVGTPITIYFPLETVIGLL